MLSFKEPKTVRELSRYLDVMIFYHRSLPHEVDEQTILKDYLKGTNNVNKHTESTVEIKEAFDAVNNNWQMQF